MRTSLPVVGVLLLATFLAGCKAPYRKSASGPPAIVIRQESGYPLPGRDSDFPEGLVAALWNDGRLVRSTSATAVGKSYIEGFITSQHREEFFSFLNTSIGRAPRFEGITVDAASQSFLVRSEGRTSEWTRVLPDTNSILSVVEARLMSVPLKHSHAVDSGLADTVR
jgi:hypothetical protein